MLRGGMIKKVYSLIRWHKMSKDDDFWVEVEAKEANSERELSCNNDNVVSSN